jgi:EamA domain-containing membrane protein RarD
MNKLKNIAATIVFAMLCVFANAQDTAHDTDVMRSHGKIYVVMAVVVAIVTGLFIYVWSIDRKISKLEDKS